jgi:aminoglycoside phosphotransferase (APT) family kinase protein
VTGIIDFGDAVIGDPARDFIFLLEDWSAAFLDEVLRFYPHEDPHAFRARIHQWSALASMEWVGHAMQTLSGPAIVRHVHQAAIMARRALL